MICGCGRVDGYHFPKGKTLVYIVYEQVGMLDKEGKEELSEPRALLEVRLKVWDNYGRTRRVTLTPLPPYGRDDVHLGRNLGDVVLKVGPLGIEEIVRGRQIPTKTRYFIPTFPSKLKKGLKWSEKVNITYKNQAHEMPLNHEYKGIKDFDGKRCALIEGLGEKKMHEEREDPANRLYAVMDFNLQYTENYCLDFKKGYLLETYIESRRLRQIKEKSMEEYFINQTDMVVGKIVLERIE